MVKQKQFSVDGMSELRIFFCFVSFNPTSGHNDDSETVLYPHQ